MKEYKFGNTKVIVYSPLLELTADEREKWFEEETAKGNPILKQIAKAMDDCYMDKD